MSNIHVQIGNEYQSLTKKLKYILKIFESVYEIPADIRVSYGNSEGNVDLKIDPGSAVNFFRSEKDIPQDISWIHWLDRDIPVFCMAHVPDALIDASDTEVHIPDILMSAFYVLSCWQEWKNSTRDEVGRFPLSESILAKFGVLDIPVVNYYFDIFAKAISQTLDVKIRVDEKWARPFTSIITHDIDQCKSGWRENSFRALLEGHPSIALKTLMQRIKDKDVWFNFDQIMKIEEQYRISSTYFFIPNQGRWGKWLKNANADYDITSQEMQSVIQRLNTNGHEIGVHGSWGTGWDAAALQKEIQKFPLSITGGRFHFLAMDVRESFDVIEQTGLQYDSSLGFAEKIGFRSGFSFPYHPYNPMEDRQYSFLEFPLMVMDRTLASSDYMGQQPTDSLPAVQSLIDEVRKFHGIFVLLWHNKFLSGYKYQQWEPVYKRILDVISDFGGNGSLPNSIINTMDVKG